MRRGSQNKTLTATAEETTMATQVNQRRHPTDVDSQQVQGNEGSPDTLELPSPLRKSSCGGN